MTNNLSIVNPIECAVGTIDGFISSRLMAAYRLDDGHVIHVFPEHVDLERTTWRYVLEHDGTVIFEATDLSTPNFTTYGEAARTAIVFLTLLPDDVEADYFESYTPEQIAWRDEHAENLALYGLEPDDNE